MIKGTALLLLGLVGAILPLVAHAQFFRDDFDGNALNSRWRYVTGEIPSEVDYTVANGLWRLNQVFPGGGLQLGGGAFYADLGPQRGPLTMRARVGWEPNSPFSVGIFADAFDPSERGRQLQIFRQGAAFGLRFFGQGRSVAVPNGGFHDLEWSRDERNNYRFRVNGELVWERTGAGGAMEQFRYFGFTFNGPAGPGLDPVYVDSIEVVPEPGTMAALGLGLATLAARRKRR